MARAKVVRDDQGRFYGVSIKCPACRYMSGEPMTHSMPVRWLPPGETEESPHVKNYDHWTFNGDFDLPVFGPSLNTWWGGDTYKLEDGSERTIPLHRCHSFIGINGAQPGQIIYLGDCTHELKNQVHDLPEFKDEE